MLNYAFCKKQETQKYKGWGEKTQWVLVLFITPRNSVFSLFPIYMSTRALNKRRGVCVCLQRYIFTHSFSLLSVAAKKIVYHIIITVVSVMNHINASVFTLNTPGAPVCPPCGPPVSFQLLQIFGGVGTWVLSA